MFLIGVERSFEDMMKFGEWPKSWRSYWAKNVNFMRKLAWSGLSCTWTSSWAAYQHQVVKKFKRA